MTGAWLAQAACTGEDPDMFGYPLRSEGEAGHDRFYAAQRICADCPVRQQCLDMGVSMGESGVWGGTLLEFGRPAELPSLARENLAACGTYAAYRRHLRRREPPCLMCRRSHAKDTTKRRRGIA